MADDDEPTLDNESWVADAESQASDDERASEKEEELAADSSQGAGKKGENNRDKAEGESEPETLSKETQLQEDSVEITYILNKNTRNSITRNAPVWMI